MNEYILFNSLIRILLSDFDPFRSNPTTRPGQQPAASGSAARAAEQAAQAAAAASRRFGLNSGEERILNDFASIDGLSDESSPFRDPAIASLGACLKGSQW